LLLNLTLISALLLFTHSKSLLKTGSKTSQPNGSDKYQIANVGTGLCIQHNGNYQKTGNVGCDTAGTKYWKFERQPEGWYIIRSSVSAQVFDIELISPFDGALMHNWDYWGGNNQKWFLDPVGGSWMIRNMNSGKCLTHNGGTLAQFGCNGGNANQLFNFTPAIVLPTTIAAGDWQLVNKASGQCVKFVQGYVRFEHTACQGISAFTFRFERQGDNSHIVRVAVNAQVVDVNLLSQDVGPVSFIHSWDYWGGGNQKWWLDFVDNTFFMLRATHSNKCMGTDGGQFVQRNCNGGDATQLFKVQPAVSYNINIQPNVNYMIVNRETSKCYKWSGAFIDNFHGVCDQNSNTDYWRFENNGGWYLIRSVINAQVMDVTLISILDGAIIHSWDYWGGNNQKWVVEPIDNTYFMLRSVHSSKCLQQIGDKFAQYTCNAAVLGQQFNVKEKPITPIIPPQPVVPKFTITGFLISATTGVALTPTQLAGAKVTFFSNTGTVVQATINTTNGSYTASIEQGGHTGRAEVANFVSSTLTVQATAATTQNFVLSPVTTDKSARFVLTWGTDPADLDLYMVNTITNAICYFRAKSVELMKLDVDKTTGRGPETITLAEGATAKYRLMARRYGNAGLMNTSGAKMDVYREGRLISTINIASAPVALDASLWDIGFYDATTGNVEVTNIVKRP